jgi:serine/threonine protein phosphatase PrpC
MVIANAVDPCPAEATALRVICNAEMPAVEQLETASGTVAYYSSRCVEKLTPNEDCAVVIPFGTHGVVIAVADGVGGLPMGEAASRITLETLADFVTRITEPARLRSAILDAIERANQRVMGLGTGAGTTLAIAQIIDNTLRTYHVGDSEIFVIGGRGTIKLQTLAHGPVAYGVHCGLIDPADALAHEHRNVVSNVVGSNEMRIELGPHLKLAPRDLVLICSDGITDNLHAPEIAAEIAGKSPEAAAAAMVEALRHRRELYGNSVFKDDDSTMILYRRSARRKKTSQADPEQFRPLKSAV